MAPTIINCINRAFFITGNIILALIVSVYLIVTPCPFAAKCLLLILINVTSIGISTTFNINMSPRFKWAIFIAYGIFFTTSIYTITSTYLFYRRSPRTASVLVRNIGWFIRDSIFSKKTINNLPSQKEILTALLTPLTQAVHTTKQPCSPMNSMYLFNYTVSFYQWADISNLIYEIFAQKAYLFSSTNHHPYIIDCGSNIGIATLFFNKLYPNAKILAFEPDPQTFVALQKNIADNHLTNVTAINKALLDKQGIIEFPQYDGLAGYPGMSLYIQNATQSPQRFVSITTDQLSHYIDRPIDLVKIDVEGAEGAIINDLTQAKKLEFIHEMIIEYHMRNTLPNESLGSIIRTLEDNNFDVAVHGNVVPPFNKGRQTPLLIYAKQLARN
jgi:FkbM family methyltransferase